MEKASDNGGRTRPRVWCIVAVGCAILGIYGLVYGVCVLVSSWRIGGDACPGLTLHRLERIGQAVLHLDRHQFDLKQIASFDAFLDQASELSLLPNNSYEEKTYGQDGWGRPFTWEVFVKGDSTVVRILSRGEDGISQNGRCDDVYVEIVLRRGVRPETTFRIPRGFKAEVIIGDAKVIE